MTQYYSAQRTSGLYDPLKHGKPATGQAFKISRSKIELFRECPRCFYLDRRLGVGRVPGFPFSLNSAVDALLKKEFDIHRAQGSRHPLMEKYGINAVPLAHDDLDKWRHNFTGVQFLHEPTNLLVFGAIDDLWVTSPTPSASGRSPSGRGSKPEFIVVDYKATSKEEAITELNKDWQNGYKRQMEIYQWLLRQRGNKVSPTGYFVYCNGRTDKQAFDGKLEFDVTLIAHTGDDSWVEGAIMAAHQCLNSSKIPAASKDCDWCNYFEARKSKMQ